MEQKPAGQRSLTRSEDGEGKELCPMSLTPLLSVTCKVRPVQVFACKSIIIAQADMRIFSQKKGKMISPGPSSTTTCQKT